MMHLYYDCKGRNDYYYVYIYVPIYLPSLSCILLLHNMCKKKKKLMEVYVDT